MPVSNTSQVIQDANGEKRMDGKDNEGAHMHKKYLYVGKTWRNITKMGVIMKTRQHRGTKVS
ncbi:hypothetical protein E2C01_012590 [Portunus trituberculatus]|uniref:Uncharacterized protein n=1 Tax=Portunus trituberculatus TaxID=210409 RepID=A0A5B7DF45_PORTR|nr:hypothetical protein [Portunus trituberculatus]